MNIRRLSTSDRQFVVVIELHVVSRGVNSELKFEVSPVVAKLLKRRSCYVSIN